MNEDRSLEFFTRSTTDALRGLAVILLLIGHVNFRNIDGGYPFKYFGEIAVISFLYLSAVGLTKTYRLDRCRPSFIYRRVRKLLIPLWLSSALFYFLDGYLLGKTYPMLQVLLNFAGIIGRQPPNGPAWFVSLIIFLYVVFFLCSQISCSRWLKLMAMMAIIGVVLAIIGADRGIGRVPVLMNYFSGWRTYYVAVFPLSVLATLYGERCLCTLSRFCGRQTAATLTGLLLASTLIWLVSYRLKTPQFVILLTLLVFWLDLHEYRIRALSWLGTISYEIYLLHLPFMENYGFVVGHEHIWLHFVVYCLFLIPLSYVFSKGCAFLTDRFLPINSK